MAEQAGIYTTPGGTPAQTAISNNNRPLLGFMLIWLVLNILQAAFLGLDGDEAYYWMLSQHMQWGYFDHPPMVALFIRLGETFGHGFLFTRLGTVILSTLSIGFVYKGLPFYLQNIRWFIILYTATLVFNVYAFITTPDACLFFFAALFFWRYKQFLVKENFSNSFWLALTITGMFYSKYHGVLLVGFVVLSNPRLLLNKYCWLIGGIVSILFIPHLYWQYIHNWPTVRFHLVERIAKEYQISFTTDYILGQILIWGPLIALIFYASMFKLKIKDKLMRAHLFMFAGTLGFFLFSSFKNRVEPHWTLIAGISYMALFLSLVINGTEKFRKTVLKVAYINIALILFARIAFLIPNGPANLIKHFHSFSYAKTWADEVYAKAGKTPVIFSNSYSAPSLYKYYHPDVQAIGYNDKSYRKTNFNLTDDCFLNGRSVFYYTQNNDLQPLQGIPVQTTYNAGRLLPVAHYICINAFRIQLINAPKTITAGQVLSLPVAISNNGTTTIIPDAKLSIDYAFLIEKYNFINSDTHYPIPQKALAPGESRTLQLPLKAPGKPGKYHLLFSIVNDFIPGNFASDFYEVQVVAP